MKGKNIIRLNETQLKKIVAESVKRVLKETWYPEDEIEDDDDFTENDVPEFDNVNNEDIARFNGNYAEVVVPDHCLPYLVNGDMEGYDDNEIKEMQDFENAWQGELANGLRIGDVCVPLDGREPSFTSSNDVYGQVGSNCYTFLVPLK